LLNGLLDVDKIETAVMSANPHLTPFEQECLEESLQRFKTFMEESTESQSIIASMVENYVNSNDTAFGAYNFRLTKPETFDEIPIEEEYEEPPEYFKSFRSDELIKKSNTSKNSKSSNKKSNFGSKVSSLNESFN